MAGRDDDLDWLYGRGDNAPEPRPFGEDPASSAASGEPGARRPAEPSYPPPAPGVHPQPAPRRDSPSDHGSHGREQSPRDPYEREAYGRGREAYGPDPHAHGPAAPPAPPRAAMRRDRPTGGRGPSAPADGRRAGRRRVRRRAGLVMALLLVYLTAFPVWAWFGSGRVDATPEGDRPWIQPGITLLLTGSDSRAGLTDEQKRELGTGSSAGERADTIMLLNVPVLGAPTLLSIPRDSYVSVPGHGENKINAAYALGGPALLAQTVEENTGVRVDGYVSVGFDGFVAIIDALGGIEMCLPAAIQDDKAHIDLPAGCQVLDGTNALGYVRMRYSDPRGDIGRAERQRDMVGATAKKALSPWTLVNPVRWISLNNAVRGAITRGQDTGPLDALALVYGAGFIGLGGGHTFAVPVSDPDYSTPAGTAVLWDEAESQVVFDAFRSGSSTGLGRFDDQPD